MLRWITTAMFVFSLALTLAACNGESTAYTEACSADTPEAYQGYIDVHPEGMHIADVRHRQDLANFKIAEKANTAAAFEKYLEQHPEGKHADEARDEAKKLAWGEAEKINTVEVMVAYKEKYGKGAAGMMVQKRLDALRYAATSVKLEEMVLERVNISGIKKADPNGYAVRAKVTNAGERACKVMKARVVFLNASNGIIDVRIDYVATPSHPLGLPLADEIKKPLQSGGDRAFEYLIGDDNLEEGWVADLDHVRVEITEIEFVEES